MKYIKTFEDFVNESNDIDKALLEKAIVGGIDTAELYDIIDSDSPHKFSHTLRFMIDIITNTANDIKGGIKPENIIRDMDKLKKDFKIK